jgi:hypothetical protein
VRDFMADKSRDAGKGIAAAARGWTIVRKQRGLHTNDEYVKLNAVRELSDG